MEEKEKREEEKKNKKKRGGMNHLTCLFLSHGYVNKWDKHKKIILVGQVKICENLTTFVFIFFLHDHMRGSIFEKKA